MEKQFFVIVTLTCSIILILLTVIKFKVHPFLALLLASFYVGISMGMNPLEIVNAIEVGVGSTMSFLAVVIGLGVILGKLMDCSGAAERIGISLQRCHFLPPSVIMVLIGVFCGVMMFVEVGVVLLIPLAFSIAKRSGLSLLTLAIPLCTALMVVHCILPPHPAALFVTNKLGANIGLVIIYGLPVCLLASLISGPLLFKLFANRLPFVPVPAEFSDVEARQEDKLPALGITLFTVFLPIILMLSKTTAELLMDKKAHMYTLLEFLGNPITAMFIGVLVALYTLGVRQSIAMSTLLAKIEHCCASTGNVLLIISAGGAFNAILKESGLSDVLATTLSNLDIHPIILAWLVALTLHAAVGSATIAMMGATTIILPILPTYPNLSAEVVTLAIGSGAIGCTIFTDSLFWLVKQYSGITLNETFKYYTAATLVASVVALGGTFVVSLII